MPYNMDCAITCNYVFDMHAHKTIYAYMLFRVSAEELYICYMNAI